MNSQHLSAASVDDTQTLGPEAQSEWPRVAATAQPGGSEERLHTQTQRSVFSLSSTHRKYPTVVH